MRGEYLDWVRLKDGSLFNMPIDMKEEWLNGDWDIPESDALKKDNELTLPEINEVVEKSLKGDFDDKPFVRTIVNQGTVENPLGKPGFISDMCTFMAQFTTEEMLDEIIRRQEGEEG